jgi:hypothetical protein
VNNPLSTLRRKPTLLKTIRISEDIDSLLKKDANAKKTTTNALIQAILYKYLEWDRFADRYGFISMTQDTIRTILEKIEDEKLSEASRELGGRVPKDMLLFWYGKTGVKGFLKYLTLISDYAGFAHFEITKEDSSYIITAHHNMGAKWSNYLRSFLESALLSTTSIKGETQVSKNSVVLTFRAP